MTRPARPNLQAHTITLTLTLACGALLSGTAFAQADTADASDWDITPRAGLALILSAIDDDTATPGPSREPLLGELSLGVSASRLLDNGAEIGARLTWRAQADNSARPSGLGGFAPPGTPTGAFSGIGSGQPDTGLRGRFEEAFVYVDGGWGEALAGRDRGVAARFHEGPPELFRFARVDTALLDPSGASLIRTRHDLTGPSAKFSYASPRILGLRAGLSLTPDADEAQGLDRDPGARALGASGRVAMGGAVEAGLNLSRVIGRDGPRLSAAFGWSQVSLKPAPGRTGEAETWSIGANAEAGRYVFGAAWLTSDNGLLTSGDFESWSVGGQFPLGPHWNGAFTYGEASDGGARVDGESWSLGVDRDLADGVSLALGWRSDTLTLPSAPQSQPEGIVVEITLSR
jgi:hypothetical protein